MSANKVSLNAISHCPQCGAGLPEGTLQGLCPRCVARQAECILAARANPAASSTLDTQPSTTLRYFGDYELLQEIARGGMGVVFKARQVSLNRTVAVKLLLAGRFSSPEFVQRFRAEAEAAANLQHPNIVSIHEVGDHEGHPYFSMDFIQGQDLLQLAREGPLPPRAAAAYLKTVAQAVHHAHEHGVLHRDLKPANILIDAEDQPRVTDFGLAKRLDAAPGSSAALNDLTATGQVLGTPGFMSPEQAGGRKGAVGPTSDVYSLGAVLYFVLIGRAPFAAGSLEETLRQIHETEPVSPRLLNPAVPCDLETICLKCLNKEPARRYATAHDLSDDLARFLRDEPIQARPISKLERLSRWGRRKPALAAAIVALNIVGAAGLAGILWQWSRAERHADNAQRHAASETAQRLRAQEAVTMLELQRAEDLLEKDEVTMGVAYLARMVRQQPSNQIASRRLLSALTQRDFALPVGPPLQHEKRVWYAEFSPDGRFVVTASLDFTARIWDARTGQPVRRLQHPASVRAARFSPDGARIVTVADDSLARLWDEETGLPVGQPIPVAYKTPKEGAQFSPDGRRLLTISDDHTVQVWDVFTGEPLLKPLTHGGDVVLARFTSDGRRIVTASRDRTARAWDAQTGEPAGPPLQQEKGVMFADLSPDGRRLVTVWGLNATTVWEIESGERKTMRHPDDVGWVSFSPDGERIVTEVGTGTIQIWNARDWTPVTKPMKHRHNASTAVFSPEGRRLLTASMDGTARIWDALTGEPLTPPLEHNDLVWSARFSPDGALAVTASADQTARIWDVRPGSMRNQPMPDPARHLLSQARWRLTPAASSALNKLSHSIEPDFSPDGEWMVNALDNEAVRLWNTRTFQPGITFSNAGLSLLMRFSPDNARLATCSYDGVTRIWAVQTGREIARPKDQPGPVGGLQFSPDGQWLAGGYADKTVRQWNVLTGAPRGEPLLQRDSIEFFGYSPDGQRLVTSDFKSDVVWLYDAATGRLLARTPEREGRVTHADFSPEGRRLITASEDGTARIWDGHTLRLLVDPLRHKGSVTWGKFSHGGRLVATGSDYGTARVWDAQSGEPVGEPMNHRAPVCSVEFSPDDQLLVTASNDATVRLWDTANGRPVSEPFPCAATFTLARFSPNGRRVLVLSEKEGSRVLDVPPAAARGEGGEQTTLLADLAEAVIGKRVNAQGALESVSPTNLIHVHEQVARQPREADFTRWLEWFFADRSTRTISPYSAITMPQYIQSRAEETNVTSWHEALMLCPTNGIAFAQMAAHHLRQNPAPPDIASADWASRQAVKFATERRQPWQRRIEVMEHTGGWTQLMAEAEQVIQSQPTNADAWISKSRCLTELGQFESVVQPYDAVFWNAKGLLHEKAGQIQQAEASFAKALEVASLPVARWDFESGRTSPNWKALNQMTNIIVERGNLSFDSTGGDPHLELYLPPVHGTTHRWFHVRMKNGTPGKQAQVFWGTATEPYFDEARVVEFPLLPNDPQFTVYTVDMGHQAWTNNRIVRLRFDPVTRPGHIDLDWICLHTNSKPPAEVSGWAEFADPKMRRLALSNLERLRRQ